MKILLEFAREAASLALLCFGLISLATIVLPSMGASSRYWLLVPILFVIHFGLKLIFSRDKNGKLRPSR